MPRSPKADKTDPPAQPAPVSKAPKAAAETNKRDGRAAAVRLRSRGATTPEGGGRG